MQRPRRQAKQSKKDLFAVFYQEVIFSQFLQSKARVHVVVALKNEWTNNERPLHFLLISLTVLAQHNVIWYRMSLWSL